MIQRRAGFDARERTRDVSVRAEKSDSPASILEVVEGLLQRRELGRDHTVQIGQQTPSFRSLAGARWRPQPRESFCVLEGQSYNRMGRFGEC